MLFKKNISKNLFVEHCLVHNKYYGTLTSQVQSFIDNGKVSFSFWLLLLTKRGSLRYVFLILMYKELKKFTKNFQIGIMSLLISLPFKFKNSAWDRGES